MVMGYFVYNQQKMIDEMKITYEDSTNLLGMNNDGSDIPIVEKGKMYTASGKIVNIQDDVVSLGLKILNGESFNDPLKVVEAKITKDTSFKIFKEPKNESGSGIEKLEDGSIDDLGVGARADFFFEQEMTDDTFVATIILIIK